MYAEKPEMAKQWEADTPKGAKLPQKVSRTSSPTKASSKMPGMNPLHNRKFENPR